MALTDPSAPGPSLSSSCRNETSAKLSIQNAQRSNVSGSTASTVTFSPPALALGYRATMVPTSSTAGVRVGRSTEIAARSLPTTTRALDSRVSCAEPVSVDA